MQPLLQKYFKFSPFFVDSASMPDLDWERLQNKIDQLPPTLVNLLTDNKTSQFVETLAQKYIQLSVQGPDVARLIRDVVIGDIFIGDMPKEISNRLGVDQALAREVANLIVSQIFTPVLEDIKKVQAEKFPGRLPAKPQRKDIGSRVQDTGEQTHQQHTGHYQGEELPESGGNIIDLRNTK